MKTEATAGGSRVDERTEHLVIRLDAMKDLATQEWKYKIVRGVIGKTGVNVMSVVVENDVTD